MRLLLHERLDQRESGSSLETRFGRRFNKARLPAPVAQYEIRGEDGRLLGRVDFAYPDVKLAIEIDGYGSHAGRKRWQLDLARQNRLFLAGWRFLRFSSRDLDDDRFLKAVRAAIGPVGGLMSKRTRLRLPNPSVKS